MKKIAVLLLSFTLLLFPSTANSASVKFKKQKDGQVCKKSEVNKTVKLPNKTVLVCTEYGVNYKNVAYKWTIKQDQLPTALPLPSAQSSQITKIYQSIIESFKTKTEYFKLTVITSPKVDKQRVDEIVSKYEKSVNFFPMPVIKKITWVFLNEDEKDWWIQKSSEIDPSTNSGWWDSGHCQISKANVCSYGNANTKVPIFYMVIGSSSQWEASAQTIADHESVHMYQMLAWANTHTNCWVVEGHANAIGIAMSSRNMDMYQYRQGQIRAIQKISPNYKTFSIDDWISAYNKINSDNDFCFSNGAGYSMGMLAIESMYDLYEGKVVDDFLIEYSSSKNFDETLRKYFKVGETEFYKNVALYARNSV